MLRLLCFVFILSFIFFDIKFVLKYFINIWNVVGMHPYTTESMPVCVASLRTQVGGDVCWCVCNLYFVIVYIIRVVDMYYETSKRRTLNTTSI